MYCKGNWATAAERASNRPTTTASSSSYGRGYQGVQFVSGGVKLGSKIEKKQPSKRELKKKPAIIESYDSDEDSDEKLGDDDDDDEVEFIGRKRKRRGQINVEDEEEDSDGDKDSDIEEIQDDSNQQAGSVSK